MKIVEDNGKNGIVVEFQDEHKMKVHSIYGNFKSGSIKNPYYPSVYGVGIIGTKYPRTINTGKRNLREYETWKHILKRSFDNDTKRRQPTYQGVDCCKEWLYYENFYEWLCSQPNYDKWHNGKSWAVDKDILCKGNKLYSPENCCLVPPNINCLFLKREAERGKYPIGVRYTNDGFLAVCRNPFLDKAVELGYYSTPEKAFQAYKVYKEDIIKQVAEVEYKDDNITEECYQSMMKYEVEIDD